MEYKSVSTHNLPGIEEAERLHAAGWEAYRHGLFMIYFRRPNSLKIKPKTAPAAASPVA